MQVFHFEGSLKTLRVSVVKLFEKTFTTEAQRSHRGTEKHFSFRLLKPGVNENQKVDSQHLIHTGLEPGDRRLEEIRGTVLTVIIYLTHLSNPKGCQESSRWSESAETTGNARLIGSHPGGVPDPSL